MSGFFIVFLVSVPVFYIVGILAAVDALRGKKSATAAPEDRTGILNLLIAEIKKKRAANRTITAGELIDDYENELTSLQGGEETKPTDIRPARDNGSLDKRQPQKHSQDAWANWYAENSINLFLYVGAFLIVAAASVLVGFSWQSYDGTTKSMLLLAASLLFLVGGFALNAMPKVRSAGITFSAIGTILIPIVGLGWYNFVFQYIGIPLGHVWIITSIVMIGVAVFQGLFIGNGLFAYLSGFGTLSFILALQHVSGMRQDMYFIGTQTTAMILYLVRIMLPKNNKKIDAMYASPLGVFGNIITPVSLFYFLYAASGNGTLNSTATGAGVLLTAVYYLFQYLSERRTHWLMLCELLLPFGLLFTLRGFSVEVSLAYFTMGFLSVAYWAVSYFFTGIGRLEERDYTGVTGLFVSILAYGMASADGHVLPEIRTMLALLPAVISGLNVLHTTESVYIIPLSFFWAMFSGEYFHANHILSTGYQGMWYLATAEFWYLIATFMKPIKQQSRQLGYFSCVLFFAAGISFAGDAVPYGLIASAALSLTLLHAALNDTSDKLFLLFCFSLYWFAWKLMETAGISGLYVPFVYSGLSFVLYSFRFVLPDPYAQSARFASYAGILAGSLGAYDGAPLQLIVLKHRESLSLFQTYGLWNAYAASVFLAFDALLRRSKTMPYVASFSLMLTVSWQLQQLQITDGLVYANLWGVYFTLLGYFRFLADDQTQATFFDWAAILLLVFPALNRSFETNGANAAMTLGVAGIAMFLTGIARGHKKFTYAGILALVSAVLSQTYRYILGLEKWMVIGILGLLFLGFAMYLLGNRKDPTNRTR